MDVLITGIGSVPFEEIVTTQLLSLFQSDRRVSRPRSTWSKTVEKDGRVLMVDAFGGCW